MKTHLAKTSTPSRRRPMLIGVLVGAGGMSLLVVLALFRSPPLDRHGTWESGRRPPESPKGGGALSVQGAVPAEAGEDDRTPPPSAQACGPEFAPVPGGRCRPLNSQTEEAYSDQDLQRFDEMRATPFVAEANSLVPKLLTPAEVQERRQLYEDMNVLADRISGRRATASEIEEYFRFRGRLNHYRMQILTYQHARAGGRISLHDPALDPEEITVPELKARYAALDMESKRDFEQLVRAREAHGLPGHEYQAWGNPPAKER